MEYIPLALSIVVFIMARLLDERDSLKSVDHIDKIRGIDRQLRK